MTKEPPQSAGERAFQHYLGRLGLFVTTFSIVENCLQLLLGMETEVDVEMAKAIFSGVRVDQAKSFIKRAREIKGRAESPILERAFAQLTIITNVRNDILHHGPDEIEESEDGITAMISNASSAMPGRAFRYPVTAGALVQMIADLHTIRAAILYTVAELAPRIREIEEGLDETAQRPWQYKSQPRSQTHLQPQKGALM